MSFIEGKPTRTPNETICLVTGAAGFIGHHLTRALRDIPGMRVLALDNFSNGTKRNIEYAEPHEFYEADITRTSSMVKIFNHHAVDVIFHLAALPRVQFSIAYPLDSNEANINGTLNVLDLARQCGVKRVIYSSSSSVYGDQDTLPLVESMKPNPLSPYALQKLTGEIYAQQYYRIHGMQTIGLRYFNVYGPRQRADSDYAAAIPKFATQMLTGKKPTVFGDGEQTRDFTYVQDVVAANIAAAFVEDNEAYGKAYNIGGGQRVSVNEIIKLIGKYLGLNVKPEYLPPVVESKHTLADTSLAKRYLGWSPSTTFEEGLLKTVNYIRELHHANS